jgi:carbonic anhydrase
MRQTTVQLVTTLLLCVSASGTCYAAKWVKLAENDRFKLMLDKQSITEEDTLKKAWVKLDYAHPQPNPETLDTQFNHAKSLWYFDCKAQKSTTTQVFQYRNSELIYSARVAVKDAEFIEPEPDSEVDIAMRHICQHSKAPQVAQAKPNTTNSTAKTDGEKVTTAPEALTEKATAPKPDAVEANKTTENATAGTTENADKPLQNLAKNPATPNTKKVGKDKETAAVDWSYALETPSPAGKKGSQSSKKIAAQQATGSANGPDNWGKLSPEYATCDSGKNQSPVNIEDSLPARLKPIRSLQRFAAKEIWHNGHTVQVNFKQGNMMVLDSVPYQMKYVQFHAPSEHHIKGKSFPLEAHFVHADNKGNLAYVAVLFEEGEPNAALAKLWSQIPAANSAPVAVKGRVIASELIPQSKSYYRVSGSITTPPCTEGVRWVIMKSPMTASKAQIDTFAQAIKQANNRPIQALNGRMIIE